MKKSLLTLVTLIASAGLIGCAKSKSADVMRPPEEIQKGGASGDEVRVEFNPAVDILFVVDNSESMKDDQERLRAGISSFVKSIGENSIVDYRIGVITVHDSGRCGRMYKGSIVDCYPEGQLQPIKTFVQQDKLDAEGKVVFQADGKTPEKELVEKASAPGFIVRGEGSGEVLKATLNVGAKNLDDGGPQFEEMFSPVLAALSPSMNAGSNKGFIRKNSQVVIIFVTDENDGSDISVEEFVPSVQALLSHPSEKINGADRLKMYGILALDGCKRQSYAASPARIVRAVKETDGDLFRICDASFGSSLGKIGSDIRKRLTPMKPIQLSSLPDRKTLKVFYGHPSAKDSENKQLKEGKDWFYNPASNQITIRTNNLDIEPAPGAIFFVRFDKVSQRAIDRGHATGMIH